MIIDGFCEGTCILSLLRDNCCCMWQFMQILLGWTRQPVSPMFCYCCWQECVTVLRWRSTPLDRTINWHKKTVINAWIIWLNDFWIYFQPWVIITLSQKYFLTITNSIVLVSTLELRFWCLLFNLSCGTLFNSAFSRRIFNCCCSEDLESIDFFRGEG